ncbi:MAG: hypothetical protein EAZ60_29130 [Oscillatoriales cyanobacterium]|nr:MAG: hypothetical protein EAZ83_22700 [Oscillatoriales cyanobacterium]TAE94711.1 MAG: hypothetical protein EAZ79_21585 [Oscillatoriales cyanobacterium]TAF16548.1 MAG: hypothetical protein EAZ73_24195 [Oscillatoriales cyanobacterium]TAF36896.1 MAG: hypothetical protein EAZ69_09355 [Oscillatoriales cyanobacterium]TAF50353.1 MAG: hypothetical protein EAZ60_29130 [Oscillatoriales cyanobacterium]
MSAAIFESKSANYAHIGSYSACIAERSVIQKTTKANVSKIKNIHRYQITSNVLPVGCLTIKQQIPPSPPYSRGEPETIIKVPLQPGGCEGDLDLAKSEIFEVF